MCDNNLLDTASDQLFFENFKNMAVAILEAGGEPFSVLEPHIEWIKEMSNNNIEISFKYKNEKHLVIN